jgi:Cu-Zn family superoxide dismutase
MRFESLAAAAALLVVLPACTDRKEASSPDSVAEPEERRGDEAARGEAEAKIQSADGMKLAGQAKFVEEPGGVRVIVEVEDAPPGPKGIHIHERGDCSDPKAKSMGEHFAPNAQEHGLPGAQGERHLGDLGNLTIDSNGKGHLEIVVPGANLDRGDRMSFVGKAIIIHEKEDTGVQPSGGSGDPIACGAIQAK